MTRFAFSFSLVRPIVSIAGGTLSHAKTERQESDFRVADSAGRVEERRATIVAFPAKVETRTPETDNYCCDGLGAGLSNLASSIAAFA